ncbi:MAG: hypothetical protein O2845_03570 [Proteobacteria bacterium]|nr:hypothetical protein [Pseudomonadota bacterium]
MDFTSIETWLKTTILGIVVLGALGSILAIFVLGLFKKLLAPLLKRLFVGFVDFLAGFLTKPVATQQTKLYLGNSGHKFQIYYTLQIMKLVWCLFIALCSLMLFLYSLRSLEGSPFTASLLVPIFVFFIFVWWGLRGFFNVFVPHVIDIDKIMNKTKAEVLGKKP